jgi:hypothetical protein
VAVLTDPSPQAFGTGILSVLRDRDLAAQLSQRARQLAETRYTYEAYLGRTREAIGPIAGATAGGART